MHASCNAFSEYVQDTQEIIAMLVFPYAYHSGLLSPVSEGYYTLPGIIFGGKHWCQHRTPAPASNHRVCEYLWTKHYVRVKCSQPNLKHNI